MKTQWQVRADSANKQELAIDLVANSSLFADVVSQSVEIGEFRAAKAAGAIASEKIKTIGSVISGRCRGRSSKDEITIFDSSGIALQDLAVGGLALDRGTKSGLVTELNFF